MCFFFNDPATTEIYTYLHTLSLHDALPISVCHNCYNPCPVDIDFGDVSMNMRALLRRMGRKSFNPGTSAAMFFLNAKDPATINATRKAMVGVGYKAQRLAHDVQIGSAHV